MTHGLHIIFYHCLILRDTQPTNLSKRQLHFKFEASWLLEDSCESKVILLWEGSGGSVPDQLNFVSRGLFKWFDYL